VHKQQNGESTMANRTIALSSAQSLGVETAEVEVRRINLASDDSGDWNIGVQLNTTQPERGTDDSVNLTERHMLAAQIKVARAEIASAAGISEDDVRTTLTLVQTETFVTQIALGKLLAVLGLSA
jgi:hypothetical protein